MPDALLQNEDVNEPTTSRNKGTKKGKETCVSSKSFKQSREGVRDNKSGRPNAMHLEEPQSRAADTRIRILKHSHPKVLDNDLCLLGRLSHHDCRINPPHLDFCGPSYLIIKQEIALGNQTAKSLERGFPHGGVRSTEGFNKQAKNGILIRCKWALDII